jgi:hypothetical protein
MSPTSQNTIVNVDLDNDNVWLLDKTTATVFDALGVCGNIPCPPRNGRTGVRYSRFAAAWSPP